MFKTGCSALVSGIADNPDKRSYRQSLQVKTGETASVTSSAISYAQANSGSIVGSNLLTVLINGQFCASQRSISWNQAHMHHAAVSCNYVVPSEVTSLDIEVCYGGWGVEPPKYLWGSIVHTK